MCTFYWRMLQHLPNLREGWTPTSYRTDPHEGVWDWNVYSVYVLIIVYTLDILVSWPINFTVGPATDSGTEYGHVQKEEVLLFFDLVSGFKMTSGVQSVYISNTCHSELYRKQERVARMLVLVCWSNCYTVVYNLRAY